MSDTKRPATRTAPLVGHVTRATSSGALVCAPAPAPMMPSPAPSGTRGTSQRQDGAVDAAARRAVHLDRPAADRVEAGGDQVDERARAAGPVPLRDVIELDRDGGQLESVDHTWCANQIGAACAGTNIPRSRCAATAATTASRIVAREPPIRRLTLARRARRLTIRECCAGNPSRERRTQRIRRAGCRSSRVAASKSSLQASPPTGVTARSIRRRRSSPSPRERRARHESRPHTAPVARSIGAEPRVTLSASPCRAPIAATAARCSRNVAVARRDEQQQIRRGGSTGPAH